MKKALWIVVAILAVSIGLYPALYYSMGPKFALLNSKSAELLANPIWKTGFYTHITAGGIALLVGWLQFNAWFRNKYRSFHRLIGKIYVVTALAGGLAGFYIGFYATGGLIPSLGFISLAIIWLYTTSDAYLSIRKNDLVRHEKMMVYSYAACFAAVTLRLWLPLLSMLFQDFLPAYKVVAWLCWVPNMAVARYLVILRG